MNVQPLGSQWQALAFTSHQRPSRRGLSAGCGSWSLHKLGVDVIPYTRLYGADEDTVYLQHTTSGEAVICEEVETLVLCQGHMADATLEDDLRALGLEFHMAGDCLAPRTAEEAVLEGLKAGVAV